MFSYFNLLSDPCFEDFYYTKFNIKLCHLQKSNFKICIFLSFPKNMSADL